MVLARLQRGLQRMYRIDTPVKVDDFVIDADARAQLGAHRSPREQLFLSQHEGELQIALFVDQSALDNLAQNDPAQALHDGNLGDFLLAIEGVSHFVYLVWRACLGQAVSALELELQAEVDKYVTCLLTCGDPENGSDALRRRIFEQFYFEDGLDGEERARYEAANSNAHRYAASLERRYVKSRRVGDMLDELRHFYRMSLRRKLEFIAAAS